MKLEVLRADPAGNITLFVLSPVVREKHAEIAKKLFAIRDFGAEQIGYRMEAEPGFDGHMEMSGGEFCGNASRAYGMLIAKEKGLTGKTHVKLKVSGADAPVGVDADLDAGTARAQMPLPKKVCRVKAGGKSGVFVHLGGIAHFVVDGVMPSEEFFDAVEKDLFADAGDLEAYGVMFYDSISGTLTPLVKVPETGSLYWEGSCGSGSLATLAAKTFERPDGIYEKELIQPAGVVNVTVERAGGSFAKAYIGGTVRLDPPVEIEI